MHDLKLTEEDGGREVSLRLDEVVSVSLKENGSTGYGWDLVSMTTPGVLELEGSSFSAAPGGAIGAAGTRTFLFRASAYGQTVLGLEYRQPWERDVPATARFDCVVIVTNKP